VIQNKLGKPITVLASLEQIQFNGEAALLTTLLDITERKRAEQQIQRQLKQLNALRIIDTAISSSFDKNITLDVLLQQVLSQLGVDAAAILLLNPVDQTIEYAASRGFHSKVLKLTKLQLNEGYAGLAVRESKTIHIPNMLESDSELAKIMRAAKEEFFDYYGVPLNSKSGIQGVLEIYHRTELDPNHEWLDFLETLAGEAAIAIDNAKLFENLQQLNAELEQRVAHRTEELNRTNIELEHANRAKDDFLATMSHELRTPLNSILGLSESLLEQRRDPLTEHQQQSLQIIESSGHHLLELINDVLDLSKIEAGMLDYYPQVVEVNALCRSSLAFIREQAMRKSIHLIYEEKNAEFNIHADLRRLKQALVNLLTNAVKFTPEGGQVTLEVHADAEEDLVQLSVIDTGMGISEQDLKQLFQPFVQVDNSLNRQFEGTGLGLVLVERLTDLHGGSVHVESEPGKGSRFTLNLPWGQLLLAQQEAIEAGGEPAAEEERQKTSITLSQSSEKGTILLAEDNPSNILMIGEYLEDHGYEIINAHDGMEAIEQAQKTNPKIILMDIQMPAMDGLEAIRHLRSDSRFDSTPIIALTALAMPGDRERCLEAGANEYLSKPVSLKKLLKTIEKMLE
jgi:signal transduction histidine kinase/CheY-like chemotaxis protein